MDQNATIKSFDHVHDYPYSVIGSLYTLILILVSVIVAIKTTGACCNKKHSSKTRRCSTSRMIGGSLEYFNSWLIRLILGKEIKESDKKREREPESDKNKRPRKRVFINGRVLDQIDVNILGAIISCFGLLVGISAYSAYLLEVSHTCSEDTAIHCFPQFINENDPENPNITQDKFLYPITNCNQWTNSSKSAKITFQCYRYAFNAHGALVVIGGLLAFFTIAMHIILSAILSVFKLLQCCGNYLVALQVTTVIVLLLVDAIAATVVTSFHFLELTELEAFPVAKKIHRYVAENGIQFLIITETLTFLLLINWKKYAKEDKVETDIETGETAQKHQITTTI